MQGHGEKITRKQDQAIAALLSQPTMVKAAEAIGVDEVTLWRWMKTDGFRQKYKDAKRQVVEHAITLLQNACSEAVQTLRDVMANDEASASSRVSASKAVLEISIKTVEIEKLEERIATLENILKHRGDNS